MKILAIAWKDLSQIARDRKSAIFLLALPVLFTLLMGAVFSANAGDPRLPVGVIAAEGEPAGGYLIRLIESSEAARPVVIRAEAGRDPAAAMQQDGLTAIVMVPAGFDAAAMRGETPVLRVWLKPDSLNGLAADRAIQVAATRLLGAYQAARFAETVSLSGTLATDRQASVEAGIRQWENPQAAFITDFAGLEPGTAPASIENGNLQASAGMMVFFMLLGTISPSAVLLSERRGRTLSRMRTAAVSSLEILAGHLLAMFGICYAQILLLALFGQWAVGVEYWADPAGMLALAAAMALFSAAFGLSLGVWTRSENQVMLAAMASAFVLGIFGGCFFSLELTDRAFAAIGRALPSAWALDALKQLALHSTATGEFASALGGLPAVACVLVAFSAWKLSRPAAEMD